MSLLRRRAGVSSARITFNHIDITQGVRRALVELHKFPALFQSHRPCRRRRWKHNAKLESGSAHDELIDSFSPRLTLRSVCRRFYFLPQKKLHDVAQLLALQALLALLIGGWHRPHLDSVRPPEKPPLVSLALEYETRWRRDKEKKRGIWVQDTPCFLCVNRSGS